MQRMLAMIAPADLDNYPGQFRCTHSSHASTANDEAIEDAFTLNTSTAPSINEYSLPPIVFMKGVCLSHA